MNKEKIQKIEKLLKIKIEKLAETTKELNSKKVKHIMSCKYCKEFPQIFSQTNKQILTLKAQIERLKEERRKFPTHTPFSNVPSRNVIGGRKKTKTKRKTTKKKRKKPKVHKGPRGGKYIIRKGKKVYV